LDFKHCKIELTPAIANQYFGSSYFIPGQGVNGWSSTEDPRLAEDRLSRANHRVNGMLTPLIKMMKFAKRHNKVNIKSYQIEEIATRSIYFMSSYRDGVQQMLRHLNWSVNRMHPLQLERLSDSEFGSLCRSAIFGNEFPE
ncbi:MAG: hypothetical protein H3C47_16260, partial [Candidatus Cloacimonetes bacterium]|nr:hypothetical protein [Candidatus Cloacimonadota bacterium]